MNDRVKRFIEEKRKEAAVQRQIEKEQILIELGLYKKEYSRQNEYSDEYSNFEWNEEKNCNVYYKKKALDVTEDEYEEILSLSKVEIKNYKANSIATTLKVIAWIIYVGGFILGFVFGYDGYKVHFQIAFICWCIYFVFGTMFLGFSEIIKLLNCIKQKI